MTTLPESLRIVEKGFESCFATRNARAIAAQALRALLANEKP